MFWSLISCNLKCSNVLPCVKNDAVNDVSGCCALDTESWLLKAENWKLKSENRAPKAEWNGWQEPRANRCQRNRVKWALYAHIYVFWGRVRAARRFVNWYYLTHTVKNWWGACECALERRNTEQSLAERIFYDFKGVLKSCFISWFKNTTP